MSSSPSNLFPVLIGDIGGTNARFQVIEHSNAEPISFEPVRTVDFVNIENAICKSVLDKTDLVPVRAILAAAGPITLDGLNLTNCHWDIVPDNFLISGPFQELVLMNDFEAQALALPYLCDGDVVHLGSSDETREVFDRTKAVLGPGTGLGVGLLVRAGDKWVPVAGEGGHVDLGPGDDREAEIWKHLETVGGRISAEQVICGDGLVNLYNACCKTENVVGQFLFAADISSAALKESDPRATEALSIFCRSLGRIAGDVALTSMARGGVYIGGGIAQKVLPFLEKSAFRSSFDNKAPHEHLMHKIATLVVTHELPALLGLAAYACSPDDFGLDIDHRTWRCGGS